MFFRAILGEFPIFWSSIVLLLQVVFWFVFSDSIPHHPTRPKKRCSALEGCCNLFQPLVSDAADGYALDPTDA